MALREEINILMQDIKFRKFLREWHATFQKLTTETLMVEIRPVVVEKGVFEYSVI